MMMNILYKRPMNSSLTCVPKHVAARDINLAKSNIYHPTIVIYSWLEQSTNS
jgi:hypothetical protein